LRCENFSSDLQGTKLLEAFKMTHFLYSFGLSNLFKWSAGISANRSLSDFEEVTFLQQIGKLFCYCKLQSRLNMTKTFSTIETKNRWKSTNRHSFKHLLVNGYYLPKDCCFKTQFSIEEWTKADKNELLKCKYGKRNLVECFYALNDSITQAEVN
jgi:hypothetical protein